MVVKDCLHICYAYFVYLSAMQGNALTEGSGISVSGHFHFLVAIHAWIVYNMFNKVADTIAYTYPFPAR